jgi:hypothetical protein
MISLKHHKPLSKFQLRIGTKIELEHTRSNRVARRIASQHLVEFPDYYTRLVKMESAAKRYWKKRGTK